jgi:hypothetical protein|tara:strand:- start:592 stop:909 length:318 start_codon:yes stop_codon:yes gene_type:complete
MLIQLLADEKGKLSAARTFLAVCLAFTGFIIVSDALLWANVPNAAYALLGTIFTGLLGWTAGPRIAQYFGPQIGAIAKGIGDSVRQPRRPDLLDNNPSFRENDER